MTLPAESIKNSCSFTPNPVLVALSQNPSRYLPPKATRADTTFLQDMRIERIPDRSAFLRSSMQQMGWSSFVTICPSYLRLFSDFAKSVISNANDNFAILF